MKKQVFKTRKEFIDWLQTINKETNATVVTHTHAKMNKTSRIDKAPNPFFNSVIKNSVYAVKLGIEYELEVNKQRLEEKKDTDFKTQSTWFYHPINQQTNVMSKSLVKHKKTDLPYMFSLLVKRLAFSYLDLASDTEIDVARLEDYLPVYKPNKKQGLDRAVMPLTIKIDSIVSVETDKLIVRIIK